MSVAARRRTRALRSDVRADLIAEAIAAFERHGYAGTSLDAVASAAGYTKGAIYSNFGGKPELFGEACSQRLAAISAELLARVEPVLDAGGDRAALIGPLAEAVTSATLDTPLRWQILLNEFRAVALRDGAVDHVYKELSRRRVDGLVALLATNAYFARLRPDDLHRAALVLLTLVNALALEHAAAPRTVERSTVEAIVASFFGVVLP